MVSLSRADAAPTPEIERQDKDAVIKEIFDDCFESVTKIISVLTGSAQEAQDHVLTTLLEMRSHRLKSDPERNHSRLLARSIQALEPQWEMKETDTRTSVLEFLQSLPYVQAAAYALTDYCELTITELSVAIRCTEAGARTYYETAVRSVEEHFGYDIKVSAVLKKECKNIAKKVSAHPDLFNAALVRANTAPESEETSDRRSIFKLLARS